MYIILVGVWAEEILGVAAGPKNHTKLPLAGKDRFVNSVINPTHDLFELKSGKGRAFTAMFLLIVSEQDIPNELVPTTVKVTT